MTPGLRPDRSLETERRAWLVAAENGHLPGGKVGGVGDVIRDLPIALADKGWKIRIITPAYGRFHRLPGATKTRRLAVRFGGRAHFAEVWKLAAPHPQVEIVVIAHGLLDPKGDGRIYHQDSDQQPFATDASKFAFFNAAVAALVQVDAEPPQVMHLHDWHVGLLPALRTVVPADSPLAQVRMVYTIHNLAYQGIRPLAGHESSLAAWFYELDLPIGEMLDPRYPNCVNFMACAIRLADRLNTVSPTYAREITRPSDPALGFVGGEGLEAELQKAAANDRLKGILNGCVYNDPAAAANSWADLKASLRQHRKLVADRDPAQAWLKNSAPPMHLLTSVGRLVAQKAALLLQPVPGHTTALESILELIGKDSLMILLGSGDRELEQRLSQISAGHANLLFLNGYAETLSEALYANGDLFLMPSSFEPCGISQMLAMRAGQPCVVHAVGGLKDTVLDGETGFVFSGDTPQEQASAFISSVQRALAMRQHDPEAWRILRTNAANQRFSWPRAAQSYITELYTDDS